MPIEVARPRRNIIPRAYYQADSFSFLSASEAEIYRELVHNSMQFDLVVQQERAWNEEIRILRNLVQRLGDCYIGLEYTIPRMGKRIDAVLIKDSIVFLLEFKVFEECYPSNAVGQVLDYALDLQNFHKMSHSATLVPVLVCTDAPAIRNRLEIRDNVSSVLFCNEITLVSEIEEALLQYQASFEVNPIEWINSIYKPTPTIIEAAQALYSGHDVQEISYKESDDNDIAVTTACIDSIIEQSKKNSWKSICFVTGVPGAGKTLVGLNIANKRHRFQQGSEEHAVFLSGNEPLVTVLCAALTDDQYKKKKSICAACKVSTSKRSCVGCKYNFNRDAISAETKSFIQMIHGFRDDSLLEGQPAPIDKIAIYDEAQRAWTKQKLTKFMRTKKGQPDFDMSEPECLIEYMDRHKDWAVIVFLVGGGQEIHDGEAGIREWFHALNTRFDGWKVFCSDKMTDPVYVGDSSIDQLLNNTELQKCKELHLSVSMRSFRSELVSAFAQAVIDGDKQEASKLYARITEPDSAKNKPKYPIYLTRDLNVAKQWVKRTSRGSERYGIIASSKAKRLRADGIIVPKEKPYIDVEKWFLNGPEDVNSSYFMEVAASEFKIQGLEIDYAVVAWEGDYRFEEGAFRYHDFKGTSWSKINDPVNQSYLKNTYRVLLTRARQGFIIYVPKGNPDDKTRDPAFYDGTYNYLKSIGIVEL